MWFEYNTYIRRKLIRKLFLHPNSTRISPLITYIFYRRISVNWDIILINDYYFVENAGVIAMTKCNTYIVFIHH